MPCYDSDVCFNAGNPYEQLSREVYVDFLPHYLSSVIQQLLRCHVLWHQIDARCTGTTLQLHLTKPRAEGHFTENVMRIEHAAPCYNNN